MDLNTLKQKFINEAETLLTGFDNKLIELEKNKSDRALIDETFRIMHTIKGASGMFGFDKVVETTHELESLFDLVRQDMMTVTSELIEISFKACDHIRALLSDESFTNPANVQYHQELQNVFLALKSLNTGTLPLKTTKKAETHPEDRKITTWHIIFYPNDEIIFRAINLVYTFHDLFLLGEYKIYNQPFQNEEDQYWSIFLSTDKGYDEIEEALMFIMDYCKIFKIADYDIFDQEEFENRRNGDADSKEFNLEALKIVNDFSADQEESAQQTDLRDGISRNNLKYKTNNINVDAGKLDTLMYLVSELVTTKSELINALNNNNVNKAIDVSEKIEKLSKLFSENALNLRLVSVLEMTEKFKRLIRDLSKQLGKKIDFTVAGSDTELDKSIIDHISEPVLHLIRNCIDHGIEMPETRLANGKDETGEIRLETVKEGNYVYITISDNGKGIDPEVILRKAIEKGFVSPDAELSDEEIINLIFLPGFSTAENLSNVSGRGVGMDIVIRKIQEIRGEISVRSVKNEGTTFNIKLQQTLSIIDTLLVRANDVTYAIPLDDIKSCILESHENIADRSNRMINIDDDLIPYISIENTKNDRAGESDKLIIISRRDKTFALVVDKIIGEYQAVIKPIGTAFNEVKFISGASLLGDGSIALLVDTEKLWHIHSEN